MPEKEIFADTVVLSNFVYGGLFELLQQNFTRRLRLTTQVMDEIEGGIAAGYPELQAIHLAVKTKRLIPVSIDPSMYDFYSTLLSRLGRGEASAITCAFHCKAVVVTDDRAARAACKEHNIPVSGTIGILKSMTVSEVISLETAENSLSKMIKAGFYSPIKRLEDII